MVPKSADRCKECFHDFNEAPAQSSGGPIFLLGSVAAMAVVAAGVLWYVTSNPVEEKILVDEETHSIVWTRRYRSGIETQRVLWQDIAKLEKEKEDLRAAFEKEKQSAVNDAVK